MKEKTIEQKLCAVMRKSGGFAMKLVSPGLAGVPDRLLLFPGGRIAFCEVKAPGRKPRTLQEYRIAQLRDLGFRVYVVDCEDAVRKLMNDMQKDTSRSTATQKVL